MASKVQPLDPEAPPAELERFIREARATAALQHPHVVTIFDSGTAPVGVTGWRDSAAFVARHLVSDK